MGIGPVIQVGCHGSSRVLCVRRVQEMGFWSVGTEHMIDPA